MKKLIFILVLFSFFISAVADSPQITVVQPNGSQAVSGIVDIAFRWAEGTGAKATKMDANLFYSDNPLDFDHLIVEDLNLLLSQYCDNPDSFDGTPQNCVFQWNSGVANDGNYYIDIQVEAGDSNIALDSSDSSFIIDNTAPNTVSNFDADSNNTDQVFLEWSTPTERGSGIDHYNIFRHTKDINSFNQDQLKIAEVDGLSFVDRGVQADTFYRYRITAVDRAGNESNLSTQLGVQTGSFVIEGGFDQNGSLAITPEYDEVFLEKGTSTGFVFAVINKTNERQCLNFTAFKRTSRIDVDIGEEDACLNPGEKTFIGWRIITNNTPDGSYFLEFRAHNNKISGHATILARVGTAQKIELIPFSPSVCAGQTSHTQVLVKNNTSRIQEIRLDASALDLLPRFIDPTIVLDEGEERFIDLEIAVPRDTDIGREQFKLFAFTEDDFTQQEMSIFIEECSFIDELEFSITLASTCQDISKNVLTSIPIQIRNLVNTTQTINLASFSSLDVNTQDILVLKPNQTINTNIELKPSLTSFAGKHNVEVIAWNTEERQVRNLCVDVKGRRLSEVTVEENNLTIEKGKHEVFTVIVDNIGDLSQNYLVRVENAPESFEQLSESTFTLQPGERRKVFVSITPNLTTNLVTNNTDVIVEGETVFRRNLVFTIKDPIIIDPPVIQEPEIAGYPKTIITQDNTTRVFQITLVNLSDNFIQGTLSFELPFNAEMPVREFSLEPKEIRTVTNLLDIKELGSGEFDGKIFFSYNGSVKTAVFTIKNSNGTENNENGNENGNENENNELTGLLGFAGSIGTGLLILLILIFAIVLILGAGSEQTTKPIWLRR